jgi:pilus assembly protein CpaB
MRRRVLIVMAALVLAGLSGVAMVLYARGVDQRAVDGKQAVSVLLAEKQIPAGTTVAQIRERGLAKPVRMPADSVPDGALQTLDTDLDAMELNAALQADQLLMRGQFTVKKVDVTGVPDGRIGVSVEVTMAPGVAEKVVAGDRVTVFVTYPKDAKPSDQRTRVLLPEAQVISISTGPPADVTPAPTSTRGGGSTGGNARAYPATLAVDQEDATRLVHAAQTGSIYLGLLGETTKVTPSAAVDLDSLWP